MRRKKERAGSRIAKLSAVMVRLRVAVTMVTEIDEIPTEAVLTGDEAQSLGVLDDLLIEISKQVKRIRVGASDKNCSTSVLK